MTTAIRRPITLAVPALPPCASVGGDIFFSDSPKEQNAARVVCLGCPVLETCLTEGKRREAQTGDVWGMVGGLTAEQRRALMWEERLHGRRPDLAAARRLLKPWWADRLRSLHRRACPIDQITDICNTAGAGRLDEPTVRLALWWLGEPGSRVTRRPASDQRSETRRITEAYEPVVERMRSLGASKKDVAAYLGISINRADRVMTMLADWARAAALEAAA